ncbi:hypothetical protein BQ8794_60170 [Mesorhizobium prunaredense]|uniref:Uncharacterized protein n=1 Tax=Mesorhizobium prunaredense TaxID=1631249 RepID=A0A1R3VG39_9HYPH|nr:hypothetical protein BQ8794_60170 [Mesorhizobium prunaredense]
MSHTVEKHVSQNQHGPCGHIDHGRHRLGRPDRRQLENASRFDRRHRGRWRRIFHHAQIWQVCRQAHRFVQGVRRQQIYGDDNRPGDRQDLFWQGLGLRRFAQDERLRARRADLQGPDLAQALIVSPAAKRKRGREGPFFVRASVFANTDRSRGLRLLRPDSQFLRIFRPLLASFGSARFWGSQNCGPAASCGDARGR